MASPTVQGGTNTARTSAETTSPVNYPAATLNKELLILHGRVCGVGAITVPGFTQLAQDSSDASDDVEYVGWKMADGTEGGTTVSVTHGNFRSSWVMSRIQGADLPTVNPPVISSPAIGATATPDPPLLTPVYGSQTYLWLWLGGWEGEQTNPPTTPPTGYTIVNNAATGTTGNTDTNNRVADYRFASTATSENPPSLTISVAAVGWTAWTVAVPPPLNQTITIGSIINSTGSTFSPTVKNSVTLGLITNSPTIFSPIVKNTVTVPLIDQTGTTFSPEVKNTIGPLGLITNSPTVFAMDDLVFGTLNQTVTVGLIDQTGVTFSPTVKNTVTLGLIDQTGVTFSPTVSNWVTLGLITNTPTVFTPTLNSSVVLGLISSTGSTFSPTVKNNIVLGLISNSYSIFAPTVSPTISLGLISNAGSTFSPTVNQNVVLGLLNNSYSIFAPTVSNSVTLGLITNTPTIFAPTVTRTIAVGLITNSPTMFAPTVKNSITLGLISNPGSTFDLLTQSGQQVTVPLITNSPSVFSLMVVSQINLDFLQGSIDPFGDTQYGSASFGTLIPHVFDLTLTRTIPVPLIDNTGSVFDPTVIQRVELIRLDQVGFIFPLGSVKNSVALPLISNVGIAFQLFVHVDAPEPDILLIASSAPVIEKGGSYGRPSTLTGVGRANIERWGSSG